jgi:transposase
MSWPTAHAALVRYAAQVLPAEPEQVTVLGIDETRRGTPKWEQDTETGKWELVADRWHIGFVDIAGGQGLLGQVEGRNSTAVATWLAARPPWWKQAVQYVVIDMCATFRAAIRKALPHARIVVDHFHIVQLANTKLAELRRRLTWKMRDRRGRAGWSPMKHSAGASVRNESCVEERPVILDGWTSPTGVPSTHPSWSP